MSSDMSDHAFQEGQPDDKDAERQERVKAKNRRAQKRYREKKLQEVDQYKVQIKELNARLRQMAEDKRAIQKDRDRLERMVKSGTPAAPSDGPSQGAHLSRPQPRTAGVKEVMEAHPYVNMDPQQQVHMYRETAEKLRALFMQGGAAEGTPQHQQILKIVAQSREVQEVLMRMFPYTAARVKADIQRAACTDIGMHTPALWQKVTGAAQLSPAQRARLISLRAELLQSIDRIVTERRMVMSSIKEMLPHPAADSGFGTMLFKAQLSTSRLRANLEQEYQATINFVFKALLETLTPVQHARCIVAAAPFLPDTMYICSVVFLEDRGLPIDHLDLLPDMESLRSDISSHGWVCGDEGHGAWPTVYRGLGVYKEPVQGSMAMPMQARPAGMLPGADTLHALPSLGQLPRLSYDFDAGVSASSQDSGQPLPPDAIAALLAVDSLALPEEYLDCCLPAEQAAAGLHF